MPDVLGGRGAHVVGLATGLAIVAAFALSSWTVAPSRAPLGLDLKVSAVASGELEVGTQDAVLVARGLRPGHEATGAVRVRNQTAKRLAVQPRLADGPTEADGAVQLELTVGGRSVFRGRAADLRRGGGEFELARGQATSVVMRASVADEDEAAARARAAEWELAFPTRIVR